MNGVMNARASRFAGAGALLGALIGLTTLMPTPSGAAAAPRARGVAVPAGNRQPSARFVRACIDVSSRRLAQEQCERAALPDIDAARRAEGIGPLLLPAGFAGMRAPLQLLVVTNLERVGRGLAPARALSPALDQLAQQGALAHTDPPMPGGATAGANWAGGISSALLTDFMWMYDDGPGSSNLACPYPGAAGCWGHRRNLLRDYPGPLLMGAATAGSSSAVLLVGPAHLPTAAPSWRSIADRIPLAVSTGAVTVTSPRGRVAGRHVTVWAARRGTVARFSLVGGRGHWWLTRSRCATTTAGFCNLWFGFRPGAGTSTATLVVHAVGRHRSVRLVGRAG